MTEKESLNNISATPVSPHIKPPTKRQTLFAIVLFLVVATFGFGPIDIGLHRTYSSSTETASCASTAEKGSDYTIECLYNGEMVRKHEVLGSGSNHYVITAVIDPFHYAGNYFTPFYKDFSMTYSANFTAPSDVLKGEVTGKLQMKIIGLCSIQRAQKIAQEYAASAIEKQIIHHAK